MALGLLALGAGPLLVRLLKRHAWSTVALDGFCLTTVSGFALLHILPECAAQAGWLVLPLALAGFALPSIAERTLHHEAPSARTTAIVLAVFGIAAHAALDGLFLRAGGDAHHGHTHALTAWAVILHRIPEGLAIWWIIPRTLGVRAAVWTTAASAAATLFGYFLGAQMLTEGSQSALALLQSLLIGSLLHVVLHAHIPAPAAHIRMRAASVTGAVIGVALLVFVIHDHFPESDYGGPLEVFTQLALESAPALLVAYLMVGLCHAFLPSSWLTSMTRGSRWSQALRGVAVGLPLPVCSCGVVPIYKQLVQQGATITAAIAFLVATPELELAAVMLTWQLMGGEVALVRMAMAALLALTVGLVVSSLARPRTPTAEAGDDGCCAPATEASGTLTRRLKSAVSFGFGPAVDSTATWILTGLFLSALLTPYVDRAWLAGLPAWADVPVAALLGLPLYVCATGSTPLAAVLLVQGLSPGAVLALLLTGPATNATTFGVLAQLHGKRTALVFLLAMWVGAVGLGYAANGLVAPPDMSAWSGDGHASPLAWTWVWALAAVFGWSLLRQGLRPFLERLFESPANLGAGEPEHGHGHDHHHHHHHAASTPEEAPRDGGCCGDD